MSMLPPGSYALVKVTEEERRDRFQVLWIDPDKAEGQAGYLWTSSDLMDEDQAFARLEEMGVARDRAEQLVATARAHYRAQQA